MSRKSALSLPLFIPTLLLVALFAWFGHAAAQSSTDAIFSALTYLQVQQQPDGGITGFSGTSDPDTTARAVLGVVASGQALDSLVPASGLTTLDYLASQAITYTHDVTGTPFPARLGLLLSAVSVAGGQPRQFGSLDLVGTLEDTFHWSSGAYSTTAGGGFSSGAASDLSQAWALLGLSLAGQPVPAPAVGYLLATQAADGSWGFGDPDTTALAVTALLSSGQVQAADPAIQNALGFFRSTQLANGGWRPSWDSDPANADSTGWILQALASAGEDLTTWGAMQGDPLSMLRSLQKPDGSIGGTYANTYSTAEALLGLAEQALSAFAQPWHPNRAALVVQTSADAVVSVCVSFSEESLTGADLLSRSGLTVETLVDPSLGVAVCSIAGSGCDVSDCFCGMPNYWSYWQQGPSGWAYASAGAGQTRVVNGSLEAWSWGEGIAPPPASFQEVCQYGDAPLALDGATATPTVEPPPATATAEPALTETAAPAQATLAQAEPSPVPQAEPVEERSGATLVILAGVLLVGLVLAVIILRRRS